MVGLGKCISKLRVLNVWLRAIRREPQNEGPKPEKQFHKNPKAVRTSRDLRLQWKLDHLKMFFLNSLEFSIHMFVYWRVLWFVFLNVATIHPIVSVPPIGHFFKNNLQSQTSELKDGTHGTGAGRTSGLHQQGWAR